jgi:ABC-type lipoprotein release transport system permease subunit
MLTLAAWRWRQSWYLLFVTGLGIIAAVLIVCTVPLFSEVTTTAGLRSALTSNPANQQLLLNISTQGLSTQALGDVQSQVSPIFQQSLKSYLSPEAEFSIQIPGLNIISPRPAKMGDQVQLFGATMQQARPHVTLVQGRLPLDNGGEIETAITPASARSMHVHVGSVITLQFPFMSSPGAQTSQIHNLQLHVVGIFDIASTGDLFWHGSDFQPTQAGGWTTCTALVSNSALLAEMDRIAQEAHLKATVTQQTYNLFWYYRLDPARITINQLDDLSTRLGLAETALSNKYGNLQNDEQAQAQYPYLQKVDLSGNVMDTSNGPGILSQYSARVQVSRIPVDILLLQVVALILIFVSMMAELLVDRQADAIAVLRSRGASSRQVFGSLLTQSIGLSVLALLIGPVLSLFAVGFIAHNTLPAADQGALSAVSDHPIAALLGVSWYAALAALVAVVAMVISLNRAVHMDVLAVRRELARTTRRPLWQRVHLDIVAALIALVGYVLSLYIANIGGLLDTRTQQLMAAPLALIAPIFLLIACILIFLRIFPFLLRRGASLAVRGRGAASMLALAQMSRAPRQTLRMTLLLALATAFAIFTLTFIASQAQRAQDIAIYQSEADFSGDMPATALSTQAPRTTTLADAETAYSRLPGVLSVSAGYVVTGVSAGTSPSQSLELKAVDTDTFAQTADWPAQASSQPLATLMQQLAAQRDVAQRSGRLPVIVDAVLWKTLDLSDGATFSVNLSGGSSVPCVVIGRVEHIPPLDDNTAAASGDSSISGGMLADYLTYARLYLKQQALSHGDGYIPVNHVWLRTRDDAASLTSVRRELTTPGLDLVNLADRRTILTAMQSDPLSLNLIGILLIGASSALLLALVGSLLASWLSARTRLTNFAVLRALGTSPRQVASVLTWEQAIIYLTAALLGVLFGALMTVTVVPALVFTSVPTSACGTNTLAASACSSGGSNVYTLQHTLPAHIVVPLSLGIAFIVLVLICIIALGMMVRVVSRPSLSQTLRLNED